MNSVEDKQKVMVRREAVKEKCDTPFGVYDPEVELTSEEDMARMLNQISSDTVIDCLTPGEVIDAITPMAKYRPELIEGPSVKVKVKLHNATMFISPFVNEPWNEDDACDKFLVLIESTAVALFSNEIKEEITQSHVREGAFKTNRDTGAAQFRKVISLEYGISQGNFLAQLNSFVRESLMILETLETWNDKDLMKLQIGR